ncbi:hypothetical protein WJX82_009320 [Trebouxia sp. C0006]
MGVPGFFSWLRRKYPQIVDECAKDQGQQEEGREDRVCDNLYIDMNHIIHGCSHPRWRDSAYESEIEICRGIQAYLERLVHTCRPQRLLMIAIDGVAPQAKMCQQRTRRFMSAHTERLRKGIEKEIRREMLAQARNAIIIPPLTSFDGNVITPGTPFMARLAAQLRRWLEYKVASNPDWQGMQVVLSDSNEPGEGEHKIMRFIRHQRACPEYDLNTRHVIYGQDADLILLALLTHEPHFSLLREAGSLEEAVKEMGLDPADWSAAKHQPLQFLNVSTLREYLHFEFMDLVGPPTEPPPASEASMYDPWHQAEQDPPELAPEDDKSDNASEAAAEGNDDGETAHGADLASSVKAGHSSAEPSIADPEEPSKGYGSARPTGGANSKGHFDFERVLQDFVLLSFLAGNDFLPSIPSLEIYGRPSGLDVLVRTYKDLLPALGGPITNGSIINPDRLKRILSKLAEDEEDAFQRLAMRKARDFQRLAERENEGQGGGAPPYRGPDGSGQWVSMGELGDNDLDSVLGSLGGDGAVQSQVFDLLTATPEELTRELAQRVMKRLEDTLKGSSEADPVKLGNPGHRARMYEQRFGASPGEGVEKMCRKVSHAYAQGLTWVLAYYVQGSTPVPVSNTHTAAIEAAENQMHGKGKQSSAADSNEGLGATWDWYYPYHYAPLISDLAKHATGGKRNKATIGSEVLSTEDDDWAPLNGPVRPLVQLMAVLPPESARACLPLKLALILEGTGAKGGLEQTSVAAALADMFPADLTSLIDMSGKMFAHTAIVKLPFANVKRLAAAAQQADPNEQELTPADEERNELRAGSIVTHNQHPCAAPLRLIAREGLSWDKARTKLTAQKRSRWNARPDKRSLSMLRLLVPSVHPEEEPTPPPGQQMPVTVAGMDLSGVPTAPFSASLLAGCELPPAVVSERDWEREQRKFGPPFMAGRGGGGGRRGGSSFGGGGGGGGGGRGFNANTRGGFSARGSGQYIKAAVLSVPRQKAVPIPIRKPSEAPIPPPAWGQRASATRPTQDRAVPDWGETPSRGPSSFSSKLDDEAIARQLQQQYDKEVNGTPGGVSSLEEDSVTVARRLQEEEERRVRRNFQPTRRTAQQVKADEDFALRMQRQEREIAAHQVAYYQEMQRRQQSLEDMGGVPQQFVQAVQLPDADFPELPTSNPTPSAEEAPKWPVQRMRDKKKQAPQSSWEAAETGWDRQSDSPSHIPAVHSNSTTGHTYNSYQGESGKVQQGNGWNESAASDGWGGVGSGGQKWGESAEAEEEEASGYEGWGDAETKYQPAAQNMGKNYTADGGGWGGGGVEEEDTGSGLGGTQATPGRGWGEAEPDQAYSNNAWGDSEPYNGVNASGKEHSSSTGWGNDQSGGNQWEGSQAGSGTKKGAKQAAAAQYMQSFELPPASSIKERAAAAAARISQENAARQRQEEMELHMPAPSTHPRLPKAPAPAAPTGFSVNSQPASVQPRYNQPTYDQAAPVQYEESAYETYEPSVPDEYAEPAHVAQSANHQFTPPHAVASQHATSVQQVVNDISNSYQQPVRKQVPPPGFSGRIV